MLRRKCGDLVGSETFSSGLLASVVVWGVYGPLASFDLLTGEMAGVHLTVAQLLTSLVIGLSGGKILTLMAEKQAATISKINSLPL